MKLFKSIIFVLAILMFNASIAQRINKKVLLTIGDEKITAGEFLKVYNKNNFNNEEITKEALEEYLELYINFKLKVKEAEALKMDTIKKLVTELKGYRKQLAEPYFNDNEVTEDLLKEAYERKLIDIRASHILIKCDQNTSPEDTLIAYNKLLDIKNRIVNGESFEDIAVELSEDPSACDQEEIRGVRPFRNGNKGDLGYFSVFDMLYPFEQGAYTTPVGELSNLIRTRYGYHLIKVTKRGAAFGKAQVAHIFLRIQPESTAEDSSRVKEKIFNIYDELKGGESFEDLVFKYSEDQGTLNKKGVLPAFGANRMVPQFYDATQSIPEIGMYSEPVQTSFGWHILKLIDSNKPGSFDEEKTKLQEKLARDIRAQKSKKTVIENLKKDYNLIENLEAKEAVYATLDSTFLTNGWTIEKAEGLNAELLKIRNDITTQQDFVKFIEENQKGDHREGKKAYFEKLYDVFMDKVCLEFLDKNLEAFYPEFKSIMKEYHDGVLLFELTDEKVWSAAVKDTLGLQEFYDQNKEKYMWGERLHATIITVFDPEKVDSIRMFAEKYPDGKKILAEFNQSRPDKVKAKTGKFSKGDERIIDEIDWETKRLSANITSDVEKNVKFIIVHEKLKPSIKELKEAKGLITADYQTYLEKKWIKQLREKYPFKVNKRVLSKLI